MKTAINLFLLALLIIISTNSCSKQDDCENPLDCLPPATQTGAGTFGCLINNKPFSPDGSQLGGPTMQISYQIIDGQYNFALSAINSKKNISTLIVLRNQEIIVNEIFVLKNYSDNQNFGELVKKGKVFQTDSNNSGEIIFTKTDLVSGIVSGTFWFDAVNEDGEIVQIREGRFDMKL